MNGYCSHCKDKTNNIVIDNDIVDAIYILNKKGYYTRFSCSGHEEFNDSGYIFFLNNDILKHMHTLPLYWYFDISSMSIMSTVWKGDNIIIRTDCYKDTEIENTYDDILEWTNSLPLDR